jgi:hypothetical protein
MITFAFILLAVLLILFAILWRTSVYRDWHEDQIMRARFEHERMEMRCDDDLR